MKRCSWCGEDEAYRRCHDEEWAVPVHDDRVLFEFLILEGAQAGLSWLTILRRREGYRKAFADFNPAKVARFNQRSIQRLLRDERIIRNKLKIESAIANARAFLDVQRGYGSFDAYIWDFVGGRPVQNRFKRLKQIPAQTPLSIKISKDLRQKGFNFVGPTIVYAHMQATGMVNDHLVDCFRHRQVARMK